MAAPDGWKTSAGLAHRRVCVLRCMGRGKNLQRVAALRLGSADRSRGEFKNGVRGKADRKPPGRNAFAYLADSVVAIDVNEIDGELHEEGMNGLAGDDPEASAGFEAHSAEKAPVALRPAVCDFERSRERCAAGAIQDLHWVFLGERSRMDARASRIRRPASDLLRRCGSRRVGAELDARASRTEAATAPSITSGFSGFMLSTSFSTGMVVGGAAVFGVLASGLFIGMPVLGGRNLSGNFSSGGVPAGMGATISGVTMTISSVLVLVLCIDWKNLPRIGMSPRNGIFWKVSVSLLSSSPPMTKL